MPVIGAALGDLSGHTQTRVYVGPKVLELLKQIHATGSTGADGPSLEKLIDFGFFGPIAKFLFLALFFVYQHITGNWGWAIIVLTVIINLALLPMRISTMKSALKMQRIQPQMEQIKAKYAKYKVTDPKRGDMNEEIMKLQKDNGVNMFGGCIPNAGAAAAAVRLHQHAAQGDRASHCSAGAGCRTLQRPDPYHILPIVLILTSFLAQYYMPSPGVDPQQQKMMAFMMPAIFGIFVLELRLRPRSLLRPRAT